MTIELNLFRDKGKNITWPDMDENFDKLVTALQEGSGAGIETWDIESKEFTSLLEHVPDEAEASLASKRPIVTAEGITIPLNTEGGNWCETRPDTFSVSSDYQAIALDVQGDTEDCGVYLLLCDGVMPLGGATANLGIVVVVSGEGKANLASMAQIFEDGSFKEISGTEVELTKNEIATQTLWLAFKKEDNTYSVRAYLNGDLITSDDFDLPSTVSFDRIGMYAYGTSVKQENNPTGAIEDTVLLTYVESSVNEYPVSRAEKTFRVASLPPEGADSFFGKITNGSLVSFNKDGEPVKQPTMLYQYDIDPFLPNFRTFATATELATVSEEVSQLKLLKSRVAGLEEVTAPKQAGDKNWKGSHELTLINTEHAAKPNEVIEFNVNEAEKLTVYLPQLAAWADNQHVFLKDGDTLTILVKTRSSLNGTRFAPLLIETTYSNQKLNGQSKSRLDITPSEAHPFTDFTYYVVNLKYSGNSWFQTTEPQFIK